jgi:hypothetical protein
MNMSFSPFKTKLREMVGGHPDGVSVTGMGMRVDWLLILLAMVVVTALLWVYAAVLYANVSNDTFVVEPSSDNTADDVLDATKIERLEALIKEKQAKRAELRDRAPAPLPSLGGRFEQDSSPAIVPQPLP